MDGRTQGLIDALLRWAVGVGWSLWQAGETVAGGAVLDGRTTRGSALGADDWRRLGQQWESLGGTWRGWLGAGELRGFDPPK